MDADRGGQLMKPSFVHLQVASACSYLRAASSPEALVTAAASLGMTVLALTDIDNPYGSPRFERACRAAGIRPIHGVEVTTTTDDALVLLARDEAGWINLCRLCTSANFAGQKGRPRLDPTLLGQFAAGLTALLLPQGQVTTRLLAGDAGGARTALDAHRAVYGSRYVYAALIDHGLPYDSLVNATLVPWAKEQGMKIVATNAVQMATPDARPVLDTLTCVREHITLADAGPLLAANRAAWLKPAEEMAHCFQWCPQAARNTITIAEECRFSLDAVAFRPPPFPLPAGETAFSHLHNLCHQGARERYQPIAPAVMAQLAKELTIIKDLGYADYFLFVADIAQFCRAKGILMQGRGSAATSVVAYTLYVTNVDPVAHNLLFERFLSPERASPPDIDVDIEHRRREEVIQYVYERWGRDRVAMVANVNSYRGRSALIDVGKALGVPLTRLHTLTKAVGHHAAAEMAQEFEAAKDDNHTGALRWLGPLAAALEAIPRRASIHNGGMVVTARPLAEVVPLERARMAGRTVIIYDKDDVEALGLIKTDLLGLGMLTCLRRSFDAVRETEGAVLTLDNVPLDDPGVYDMLCEGDSIGVFQVESRAQIATLPRVRPRNLYDLALETALIRPGPIQGAAVHPLIRRRQGREPVTYPHPDLEPILRRSYGVVLYQEQGMAIAMRMAGFTGGEADMLRRAMGSKRSREAMERLHGRFIAGAVAKGYDERAVEEVWQMIQGFATYGFPESHALSFSLLIAVSAYLKKHYPAQFLLGLLDAQPMGFYSVAVLISDAERHGITVMPPDINASGYRHRMERATDGRWGVRLGLRLVRGVGEKEGAHIETATREGAYRDLYDVVRRLALPKDVVTNIAAIGAFASLGLSRREAAWAAGMIDGRATLLPDAPLVLPSLPPLTTEEEVRLDYLVMGCTTGRRHPMQFYREEMERWRVISARDLVGMPHGARVRVGGVVAVRQRPGTAKGIMFLTIEDETGAVNIVVMPDVYQRERTTLRTAPLIAVEGWVERVDGVIHIRAIRVRAFGQGSEASALLSKQFA